MHHLVVPGGVSLWIVFIPEFICTPKVFSTSVESETQATIITKTIELFFLDKEISWCHPQQKVSHVKIGEIILKLQHIRYQPKVNVCFF